MLSPTAVPSAWHTVLSTDLSKSRVTLANLPPTKNSITTVVDSVWTCTTLCLSAR